MLKLILLIPAVVLLALGAEGLYHAAISRETVSIPCDQFVRARPSSHRLRLTGCQIDVAGAGYRESRGQIQELFLPARPTNALTLPAPIVAATRDPAAIALAQGVFGGGRVPAPDQSLAVMQKVVTVLRASNELDGLERAGVMEGFRSRRILSGLATPVAADAALVDLNGSPDLVKPALAAGAGLLLVLISVMLSRRPRAAKAPVSTTEPLPAPAAPMEPIAQNHSPALLQPTPLAVTLPGLLLLNLDVAAGPEAIEAAPPLGSRGDVVAILCGVITDLQVDAAQRVLKRPDQSVRIDLGTDDDVQTAVVQTRGEAGVALVKEVLDMTGWRAFAPKTGLFVTAADLAALAALAHEETSDRPPAKPDD
jgi:hypothetical protein